MNAFRKPVVAWAFATATMTLAASHAEAAILTDLFNTGVGATGSLLAGGVIDPHYTLISSADPARPGPAAYVVNNGFPIGTWLQNGPDSKWIGPRADAGSGVLPGNYTYRTTFDLDGFDPGSVAISGLWGSDNNGVDILINGISTGQTTTFENFRSGLTAFAITTGFHAGVNTIDFLVHNGTNAANPSGLRVELHGSAQPVPEASTWAMVLVGLSGMALVRVRRRA
ncbi:MAG: hypothetical protein U1F52_00510 [Burkholderiales bacterium]